MSLPTYPKYKPSGVDWLGEVPQHWLPIRYKHIFREKLQKNGSHLPAGAISFGTVVFKSEESFNADTKATYQEVLEGEFLINPINLNYDLKSLRTALSEINTCVSPAYIVLRAKGDLSPSFLRYQLFLFDIRHMKTLGAGVRQTITFADIGSCFIHLPPRDEQDAIAAFLDRETTKIDELVAEQRRLIELLKEKRQAVISHAVTKGLNPDAPLKPSGIEWLGDIPEHWTVKRLGHFGRLQNGLNISREAFGDGSPFFSYRDVFRNEYLPKIPSGLVLSSQEDQARLDVRIGDVLFTRTSETVDEIGVASACIHTIDRATFAGFLIRFRPNTGVLDPSYSAYLFRNSLVQRYFAGTMNLVTRASLSQDVLKTLSVCLPPIVEQKKLAEVIGSKVERFNHLTAVSERAIDLLQERRIALISAAVTGKIDVRGIGKPEAAI